MLAGPQSLYCDALLCRVPKRTPMNLDVRRLTVNLRGVSFPKRYVREASGERQIDLKRLENKYTGIREQGGISAFKRFPVRSQFPRSVACCGSPVPSKA